MATYRLIDLPHNFKLVDFLYDDAYFQRSRANFWDFANPTDFDCYLHFPDCLCDQVIDCPIVNRKHFYFWYSPVGFVLVDLYGELNSDQNEPFSLMHISLRCARETIRSWCNRSVFMQNYHYIHFKILQDFLLSSFNIPKYISRLTLPSLCEPRYHRDNGLIAFGLKPYTGLFCGYSPNLIHIGQFPNQFALWQALYILIIDRHPSREILDFIENCCLMYAPRRFRRNRHFSYSFFYRFGLPY